MNQADQNKVRDTIAEQLCCQTDEIDMNQSITAFGGDSLDMVEIAVTLEDMFDVEILDDELAFASTGNDLIAAIDKRRPA